MRVRHIVICGLSVSTLFYHILINGTISEEKKLLSVNVCFFLYKLFLKHFFL